MADAEAVEVVSTAKTSGETKTKSCLKQKLQGHGEHRDKKHILKQHSSL